MAARSNHYGDVSEWIISVFESCVTTQQMMCARKLIYSFERMFYNDNYQHNIVIWNMSYKIRNEWDKKFRTVEK
jgi:hypothetical protein